MTRPSPETRKDRERDFHDERFGDDGRHSTRKFYVADAGKERYRERLRELRSRGSKVLEYGCGAGSQAHGLARSGADVTAIDISPVAIERAQQGALVAEVDIRFLEMDAEALEFEQGSFDLVCGSGVLHHLELDTAFAQIARVLRPGGTAVFIEPLGHNPFINAYRRLTPSMRTDDEHPLRARDLRSAEKYFGSVDVEHYSLTALAGWLARRLPRGGDALVGSLHRLDRWLFRNVPPLRRWAWVVVLEFKEPRSEPRT